MSGEAGHEALAPSAHPPGASRPGGVAKPRLHGIDGLRAFAAVWVVMFHVRAFSHAKFDLFPGLDLLVRSGSIGVSLFLVLSGFCLFLPFAGGRLSRFRARDFIWRRCRRLLPPYYVSLAVLVVLHVVAKGRYGFAQIDSGAMFGQVLTHATLVHQFFPGTFYGLNGAYWSLGLEWELYLALPILIGAARRYGLRRTVTAVVAVSVVYSIVLFAVTERQLIDPEGPMATAVLPNFLLARWAEFSFGMVAAELYVTGSAGYWARRLVYVAVLALPVAFALSGNPLAHVLFGLVFLALVCTVVAGDNFVARLYSWPPLVLLGVMSYSLYLVHQPLIEARASVLRAAGRAPDEVLVSLVVLLPALLLVAWLLFVLVERRTVKASSSAGLWGHRVLFGGASGGGAA